MRLPPELKERIAESAKAHNRSMNADIVARLEKSFEIERIGVDAVGAIADINKIKDDYKNIMAEFQEIKQIIANNKVDALEKKTPD